MTMKGSMTLRADRGRLSPSGFGSVEERSFTGLISRFREVSVRRPVTLSPHSNANQAKSGKDVVSGGL
jgi:hypothetical protein